MGNLPFRAKGLKLVVAFQPTASDRLTDKRAEIE